MNSRLSFVNTVTIFLSLGIHLLYHCVSGENRSVVILAKPMSSLSDRTSNYAQRKDIFEDVADTVNIDFSLHHLELITADSGPGAITRYGDPYSGNVLQVIANLTWKNRLNNIIGIAGFVHPELLYTLQKFGISIASLVYFGTLPSKTYLTASTLTLADSLLQFVETINQTKFGLVTELHNSYFLSVSNKLFARTKHSPIRISIKPYVQLGFRYVISNVVDQIAAANIRTIILSVHPSVAIQILCEAYKSNLKWPDYVWIMIDYQLDDLMLDAVCPLSNITEGTLLFQLVPNELVELIISTHSKSCRKYLNDTISHIMVQNPNPKPLTFLIYNAILTLAAASKNKSSIRWENFNCSNNVVYVYQISRDGLQNLIGIYDSKLHMLTNFCEAFSCRELDLLVVLKDFPFGYLMVLPCLCIITNTILLVLYIYFYKEPSIKSTSISLSLLIFLSCYLLSVYTITLLIHKSQTLLWVDLCPVLVWVSGTGLSLSLIFAAILVKMLRVYRIFTQHRILKPKMYTSTYAHFAYAILIVSPPIVIMLLWTFIDPYHNNLQYVEHSGFITVKEKCRSKYLSLWFTLLLTYTILLSFTVVAVAIKSRKIRLKEFKDTKKVNVFIFLMIIIGIKTFSYWRIFANYTDAVTYILYTGHLIMAFLCQIFLFVPKVWPPVRERFLKRCFNRMHHVVREYTLTTMVSNISN